MTSEQLHEGLLDRLRGLTSVKEIVRWLDEVERAKDSGLLEGGDPTALLAEAASILRAFSPSSPELVRDVAVQRLLAPCLDPVEPPNDADAVYFVSRLRDTLAELLDALPEEDRATAMGQALDRCSPGLATSEPERACWTIQRFGERRADIVELLRRLVTARDDDRGDTALETLASLGTDAEERHWVVTESNARAARRFSYPLFGALRRLRDPSSLAAVTDGWLGRRTGEAFLPAAARALDIYAEVAEADHEDEALQDRAWQLTTDAVQMHDELRTHIRLWTGIAPKIDSRHVVPDLARWLTDDVQAENAASWGGRLAGLRLTECTRRRHLESWTEVDVGALTTALQDIARRDTGETGIWMSQPMREKEAAWDLLLRAGSPEPLRWCEDAVGEETNPYVRLRILERLACFRLPRLPDVVARWIEEPHTHERSQASGRWAYVSAAISLAHSQMTREAFDILLRCGFSFEGHAAANTAAALREVSEALAREGDGSAAAALWDRVGLGYPPHQRDAAAEAIAGLAAAGLLGPDVAPKLLHEASDKDREVHERSLFVEALMHLGRTAAPQHAVERIEEWASRDDWLGARSLECLARWGVLGRKRALLESRLGLRLESGVWRLKPDAALSGRAPHVTGILFLEEPDLFARAVADWLLVDRAGVPEQVLSGLDRFRARHPEADLPPPIIDALTAAARERHGPGRARSELLDALADFVPDAILEPGWANQWLEWLPEIRVRFADALGRLAGDEDREEPLVRLLLLLGADPVYAVRRAALRALGRVRGGVILALHAAALAELDDPRLRARAAEAVGWIPPERDDLFENLKGTRVRLARDVDRRVRTALEQALQGRMERRTTAAALERVRSVRGAEDNSDILGAWAFCDALAQLGDDDAHRVLREHLATAQLPRHVSFWIGRLRKAVDESWQERIKEQPAPWLPWKGEIRTGSGRAHLPDGASIELTYAVWARANRGDAEQRAWGGSLRLREARVAELVQAGTFELEVEGGARASAVAAGAQDRYVAVAGTGSFPGA